MEFPVTVYHSRDIATCRLDRKQVGKHQLGVDVSSDVFNFTSQVRSTKSETLQISNFSPTPTCTEIGGDNIPVKNAVACRKLSCNPMICAQEKEASFGRAYASDAARARSWESVWAELARHALKKST